MPANLTPEYFKAEQWFRERCLGATLDKGKRQKIGEQARQKISIGTNGGTAIVWHPPIESGQFGNGKMRCKNRLWRLKRPYEQRLLCALAILLVNGSGLHFYAASGRSVPAAPDPCAKYFRIQVIDEQTGRGVPLVELRTVNNIRYVTDSNGIVAFCEPGLMDQQVFFYVESHGYEFPKDGFGFQGTTHHVTRGGSAVLKIKRINIAERLYRVTGEGIYRDSVLTGQPVPLEDPLLNGLVLGQDSVCTCVYRGHLYWFWGDTNRPSYPLGNFAMSGAISDLPGRGGLDPGVGVNLRYFVDQTGFSKKMCPLPEPGMVWLEGPLTVNDKDGKERLIAKYARMKTLGEAYERGLVVYNDQTDCFERLVKDGFDFFLYPDFGHPFRVEVDGQPYYYFATPFPLGVRLRVKADWEHIVDSNAYEVYTGLSGNCRWIVVSDLVGKDQSLKKDIIGRLKKEKELMPLYDIETGKAVSPHAGTVYWNSFRRRWVMIAVQQYGQPSFLGEVWYAEADTPVGPWAYARKIVTHNKYSFYNPKHHPYFDQDGGRLIYFEGTYSHTFSGDPANATPRYDYNQIMYRLALDDRRLCLPVAVYQVHDPNGKVDYLLGEGVRNRNKWEMVEANPFFAIPPDRVYDGLIPVYAARIKTTAGSTICLQTGPVAPSETPLFYAIAAEDNRLARESPVTVLLYEYRNGDTAELFYSTDPDLRKEKWVRSPKPVCCVWKNRAGALVLDHKARPAGY
jgi:hypothetical protein